MAIPAGVAYVDIHAGRTAPLLAGVTKAAAAAGAAAEATLARRLSSGMQRVGKSVARTGKTLTRSVTLPLVAAGVASVKMSTDFETSMSKITSLVGIPRKQVNAWKDDVRALAVQFGKSGVEAADALFFITSAGLKGDAAMQALEASLKASAVGLGDTKTVADLATSAMNAYKASGLTAAQATDVLAAAVKEGKLEAPELASAMGRVLPVASAMGVSFDEAGAALAAMSRTGTNAAEATTQLRSILTGLLKPSKGAQAALAELGLSAGGIRKQLREQGLLSVLQTLSDRFDGNQAAMAKVFPNIRALSGFMDLMGGNAADTEKIFGSLENSTGALDKAFAETQKTAGFQMQQAFAALKDAAIDAGDALAPIAVNLAGLLKTLSTGFSGLNATQKQWIISLALVAAAAGPVLFVVGKLLSGVGLLISAGISVAGALAKMVTGIQLSIVWLRIQALTLSQNAAAAGLSVTRYIALAAVQRGIAAVTIAWTAAQWLLNVALTANPIGVIVMAIAALVAGLVLAWQNSETFRNIVMAAWEGIKTAAATAWMIIKPIFDGIAWVIGNVIIPVLQALWRDAQAVWGGIMTVIRVAWSIIKPIFDVINNIITGVLKVAFIILWNAVKIVWIGIQIAIKIAWAIIKKIWSGIKSYIDKTLIPAFNLFKRVVGVVWNAIKSAISTVWRVVIKPIWEAIKGFLVRTLGPSFEKFRRVVTLVWNVVKAAIKQAWERRIKPVFEAVKAAVGKVRDAFKTAVDGIKRIWNRIVDIAKKPVNFVIGIYNDGIVSFVNRVAKFADIKTRLDPIKKLARGGVLAGYQASKKDDQLVAMRSGEGVLVPEVVRGLGSNFVHYLNAIANRGGVTAVRRLSGQTSRAGTGQAPAHGTGRFARRMGFAAGGIVPGYAFGGIIGGFIDKLKDFTFGNLGRAAKSALDAIIGVIPGAGMVRDVIAAVPRKVVSIIVDWIKKKVDVFGGAGIGRAAKWARTQHGKPYLWGGAGPTGYDCSGWTSVVERVIRGLKPVHRRMHTTHSFGGTPPGGYVRNLRSPWMVGVSHSGVGHMAGTLGNKLNVESSGGRGVRVGGGARGVRNFPNKFGFRFDGGGWLRPGDIGINTTRRPEPVLTDAQWKAISRATQGGDDGMTLNVYPQRAEFTMADLEALERRQNVLARARRAR